MAATNYQYGGTGVATPSPYTGPYTNEPTAVGMAASEYVMDTQFNLLSRYAPDLLPQYLRRHNEMDNFYMFLKQIGHGKAGNQMYAEHMEEDWIEQAVLISSATASGTTDPRAAFVITVAAASVTSIGGIRRSYLIKYDKIQLPNGTMAWVVTDGTDTGSALTYEVAVVDTTAAPVVGNFANARVFVIGTMFAEGQGLPQPRLERTLTFRNGYAIAKTSASDTGSNITNMFPVETSPGVTGPYWNIMRDNAEKRHMSAIAKTLLFDRPFNNVLATQNDNPDLYAVPAKGTLGLLPYAQAYANLKQHVVGGFTIDDFDERAAIFVRERVGSNVIIELEGHGLSVEKENALKDFLDNTNVTYATAGGALSSSIYKGMDNEGMFVNIGFRGIKKAQFTYLSKRIAEFDDAQNGNATGHNYTNWGLSMPYGSIQNKGGARENVPMIGYKYKALNGYSREAMPSQFNGADNTPIKTHKYDQNITGFTSEIAGQWALGNQMILDTPLA